MKRCLAACILLLLLSSACVPKPTPALCTEQELLDNLRRTYGIDFVLLSDEPYSEAFVVKGRHYIAAPAENTGFRFDIYDMVRVQNPGPIPVVFPEKYHVCRDTFLEKALTRKLLRFCAENGVDYEDHGRYLTLPADGWEETVRLLSGMVNALNEEFPFYTGGMQGTVRNTALHFLCEVAPGVVASARQDCYRRDDQCYGMEPEAVIEDLRADGECNAAVIALRTALCDFLDREQIPYQFMDRTSSEDHPNYSVMIFLPDEQALERTFPLLDVFFQEQAQAAVYQAPGAGRAAAQFGIVFRRREDYSAQTTCTPFQQAESQLHFDAEAEQAEARLALFPQPTENFISGDRITIDGDSLIVERGEETLVIDRGTPEMEKP